MARGSVQKRPGGWSIVYDMPVAIGRKQKRESGFRTKREAEAALTARLREVDTGTALDPTKLTVAAYLDHWLVAGNADIRAITLQTYRMWVTKHIAPHLGAVPLAKLNAAHLDGWLATLRQTLAPSTARRIRGMLATALNRAVRWRFIPTSPASLVRAPRVGKSIPQHWDTATAARFLAAVADDPGAVFFVVALGTGMRRGELLALRWADVDLERATLLVRRTRVRVSGKWVEDAPKNGEPRTLDLDPDLVATLRAHRDRQRFARDAAGKHWRDLDYVFCEPPWRGKLGGRPWTDDMAAHRFRRLIAAHDLPALHLHGLRHTHATILLEAGVHPKMVQERLGHASYTITMDTYSHVTPRLGKVAALAYGAAVGGGE